jgi:hypothetical protein
MIDGMWPLKMVKRRKMKENEEDNFIRFAQNKQNKNFISSRLDRNSLDPRSSWNHGEINYNINEFGYRSFDEFQKNVDLLALGCSNTWGHGLPIESTWPEMLRSENIKTINSIASNGDSAMGQVIKFFQYVKMFGNPKNVVAVFPSSRMEFPLEDGRWHISNKEKTYTLINDDVASIILSDPHDENFKEYLTAPYDPNDLLTKDVTRYFTHTFIDILETYCEMFGINFKYTIWEREYRVFEEDDYANSLLEYMQKTKPNFFTWDYPRETKYITEYEKSLECHSEHKDHPQFYRASDFIEGRKIGHFGMHSNLHLAEAIKKALGIE